MASINLAPGTQLIIQAQKRRRQLFLISGIIAVVVIVITASLALYERAEQNELAATKDKVRAIDAEIARMNENAQRIKSFEGRLKDLDSLLDNHVSWNPVLTDLERLLPPETVLSLIESRVENGTLLIEGKTPDVDKVATTFASLENQPTHKTIFDRADLGAVTRQEVPGDENTASVSYAFSATLHFDPKILYVNQ